MRRILEDRPLTEAERHQRYVAKPGVKERRAASYKRWAEKNREQERERKRSPEYKAQKKEYCRRPEVKARNRMANRERLKSPEYRAGALLRSARGREKRFGLSPTELTVADVLALLARGSCPYTGIPFSYDPPPAGLRKNPWSPSLDQIDARKGYVVGNVEIVSTWWNLAKNEWPAEVMQTALSGIAAKKNPGA